MAWDARDLATGRGKAEMAEVCWPEAAPMQRTWAPNPGEDRTQN